VLLNSDDSIKVKVFWSIICSTVVDIFFYLIV
jgi:hypothetical protein